jgi:hypothetical protein
MLLMIEKQHRRFMDSQEISHTAGNGLFQDKNAISMSH